MRTNSITVLLNPPVSSVLRQLNHRYPGEFNKLTETDLAVCVLLSQQGDEGDYNIGVYEHLQCIFEDVYEQGEKKLVLEQANKYVDEVLSGQTLSEFYRQFSPEVSALFGPKAWVLENVIELNRPNGILVRLSLEN